MFFRRFFTHLLCWLLIFPLLGGCGLVQMLQEQPQEEAAPKETSWAADPVPYDVRIVVEKPLPRPDDGGQRLKAEAAAVRKEVAAARADVDPYARPLEEEKEENPRKLTPSAVDPDAAHETGAPAPRRAARWNSKPSLPTFLNTTRPTRAASSTASSSTCSPA